MIKLNIDNMPQNIEIEIRGLYNDLQTTYQAIQSAKSTLALAEEALRVKKLLYDSGLTTLADVQKAQVTVYQTNQLLTSKISAFDIATYEWNYATGVGTKRIEF
jgi:outer membrane protein TolC